MCVDKAFHKAATERGLTRFDKAFDTLVETIAECTAAQPLDACEPQIRKAFKHFLRSVGYRMAEHNFEKLLEEKSGDKFLRNDGTTNWYHEFLPLVSFMYLARIGKKNGGIDLDDLIPWGGMEAAICTHLRHDSLEDQQEYKRDATLFRRQQEAMLADIRRTEPAYDVHGAQKIIAQVEINMDLITQKRLPGEGGVMAKEHVRTYTKRMVSSDDANPAVFMLKQLDGIHNFATMWAPKFTPAKRLKRCDEREDMYGPRNGYTDAAMKRWPDFKKGIQTLDSIMGMMLYPHFRYLESVDLFYKEPDDFPVGIGRYLTRALSMELPPAVNLPHIFMRSMMTSVTPEEDPEKFARLENFLEHNIRPAFHDHRHKAKVPYLFEGHAGGNGRDGHPAPVAM